MKNRIKVERGMKLKLLSPIEDPFSPKNVGDVMTVEYVDDIGQIHGSWKSGGSLAIIPENDNFTVVNE